MINSILGERGRAIVLIGGPTCSGKDTAARSLIKHYSMHLRCNELGLDGYYNTVRGLGEEFDYNFDHPDSMDLRLASRHLRAASRGVAFRKPVYDFSTHSRSGYECFVPGKLVIATGLHALNPIVAGNADLRIYTHCSEEEMFRRRMARDTKERGRTPASVEHQWKTTVIPMNNAFVKPTRRYADLVLDNSSSHPFA